MKHIIFLTCKVSYHPQNSKTRGGFHGQISLTSSLHISQPCSGMNGKVLFHKYKGLTMPLVTHHPHLGKVEQPVVGEVGGECITDVIQAGIEKGTINPEMTLPEF